MAETKITPFRHFHKQMRFLFSLAVLVTESVAMLR